MIINFKVINNFRLNVKKNLSVAKTNHETVFLWYLPIFRFCRVQIYKKMYKHPMQFFTCRYVLFISALNYTISDTTTTRT